MRQNPFIQSLRHPFEPLRELVLRTSDARALPESVVAHHDSSVAPEYFALEMWPGVQGGSVRAYLARFTLSIPDSHIAFLSQVNGLTLGSLRIFGVPPSMLREPPMLDRSARQPLDLAAANRSWRLGFPTCCHLFHLGSLRHSHSENAGLFLAEAGGIVAALSDGRLVGQWPGYTALLEYGIRSLEGRA